MVGPGDKIMLDKLEKPVFLISNEVFAHLPSRMPSLTKLKKAKIVAHRGAFDNKSIFENTLDSIQACLNSHIWGVELDIRWTKDLKPVIFHDSDLNRMFGVNKKINQLTWKEIKAQYSIIPSLDEVVQQFGHKIHFFFELKNDDAFEKKAKIGIKNQYKKISRALSSLSPIQDFHFMSFDSNQFNYLDNYPSETFIPIAQINIVETMDLAKKNKYAGVACHYLFLSSYY